MIAMIVSEEKERDMQDQLVKYLAFDGQVRLVLVQATNTVQEACRRHDTWHTASAAFGRTMIGSLLLASNLKGEDRIITEIQGTGPIGRIVVDVNSHNQVRGYVNQPHVALELNEQHKLDVSGAVGLPGTLTVRRYIEHMEPFVGQVALVSGEIGDDFTYYMTASEQTPSSFGLSVLVNPDESIQSAGGFMIQMMPGATEETIQALEANLSQLDSLATYFNESESLVPLVEALVGKGNYKELEAADVSFHCPCSKAYYQDKLAVLDEMTLREMIEEDHGAEVTCHFCNEQYQYSEEDLREVLHANQAK